MRAMTTSIPTTGAATSTRGIGSGLQTASPTAAEAGRGGALAGTESRRLPAHPLSVTASTAAMTHLGTSGLIVGRRRILREGVASLCSRSIPQEPQRALFGLMPVK